MNCSFRVDIVPHAGSEPRDSGHKKTWSNRAPRSGLEIYKAFDKALKAAGVKLVESRSLGRNSNAHAARRVGLVTSKRLSKMILFDEALLRGALANLCNHRHTEGNHRAFDNEPHEGDVIVCPRCRLVD
jgi:hypothetical protein